MRPEAKFSDGTPITVDDVIFSHALLRDHGRPNHRSYYKKVTKVEQTGERKVQFTFDSSGDREMPLIIGLDADAAASISSIRSNSRRPALVPPIGSGPYTVAKVDPGKSITYGRDPNYWGRDLPVNRGLYNFDEIRFDYYRDAGSMFESFQVGPGPLAQRGRSDALDGRLRFPRAARRPRASRRSCRSRRPPACRRSCSTRDGRCSPIRACARR